MNFTQANDLLQGRNKESRKLENNTYLIRKSWDVIAIRLHATEIITFYADGKTEVQTGGWQTPTTKARLNDYLNLGIYQHKGEWFLRDGRPFEEGELR
jgi:hypothetical protein